MDLNSLLLALDLLYNLSRIALNFYLEAEDNVRAGDEMNSLKAEELFDDQAVVGGSEISLDDLITRDVTGVFASSKHRKMHGRY